MHPVPIQLLIESFAQMPGIGLKSAERMAFHLLNNMSVEDVETMVSNILNAKHNIKLCPICQNLTDAIPCVICSSSKRDPSVICVVEMPKDALAIERTNEFNGLYHVLHGALSPMDDIGPDDIKIKELIERLSDGRVTEIILATNSNVAGTATAMYISRLISPMGIKVTRIAHGIPIGSDLEYADEMTIVKALEGRQVI